MIQIVFILDISFIKCFVNVLCYDIIKVIDEWLKRLSHIKITKQRVYSG